jgi:hypothetical protein
MAFCRISQWVSHGIWVAGRFMVDMSMAVGLLILLPFFVFFVRGVVLLDGWRSGGVLDGRG